MFAVAVALESTLDINVGNLLKLSDGYSVGAAVGSNDEFVLLITRGVGYADGHSEGNTVAFGAIVCARDGIGLGLTLEISVGVADVLLL